MSNNTFEQDMDWFFNDSESALGISSSFGIISSQACYGKTVWVDRMSDALMDYVDRYRRIENTMKKLTRKEQITIQAAHQIVQFSPIIRRILGDRALIALLEIDYDKLESLCNRVSLNKVSDQDKILLSQLRVAINERYRQARAKYIKKMEKYVKAR